MKKRMVAAVLVPVFAVLLFACAQSGKKIFDFKADDVVSAEVYYYSVPALAERKVVTGQKDIKEIMKTVSSLKITGNGENAENVDGGAIQFVFNKKDGGRLVISYNGVSVYSPNNFWYTVDGSADIFGLWGKMDYQPKDVEEYELPLFPKNEVPHLTLSFVADGETYYTNAARGGYNWTTENPDGTAANVIADAPHPLDYYSFTQSGVEKYIIEMDISKITLNFSMPTDIFTVRYWADEYIGDANSFEANYETLDTGGKTTIILPRGGYVYEVNAKWMQGDVSYFFYVKP